MQEKYTEITAKINAQTTWLELLQNAKVETFYHVKIEGIQITSSQSLTIF